MAPSAWWKSSSPAALKIDWCIVGEPSSEKRVGDTIKIGRRGPDSGRLTVQGVQGHVAYPQLAENPVHMLRARAGRAHPAHPGIRATSTSSPPASRSRNLNAATGAPNVIPGEPGGSGSTCATHLCRLIDGSIQGHRRRHPRRNTACAITLEWYVSGEPFDSLAGSPVRRRHARRSHAEAGHQTEVRPRAVAPPMAGFIAPLCSQVVELGVINATIHKVNESGQRGRHRSAASHLPECVEGNARPTSRRRPGDGFVTAPRRPTKPAPRKVQQVRRWLRGKQ